MSIPTPSPADTASAVVLSDAARAVWAKNPVQHLWLPLWQHMDEAAAVAARLFDHWLAPAARQLLAEPFGGDTDAARTAVSFLAAVHDIGKATPAFAVQSPDLAERMRAHGLAMPVTKDGLADRSLTPHALAGHHLLSRWLQARGWRRPAAATWAAVVGGHHGTTPDAMTVTATGPRRYPALYGTGLWEQVQDELLDRAAARTGADVLLAEGIVSAPTAAFQTVSSGLVILADWIASNEDLFPLREFRADVLPESVDDPERLNAAMRLLDLPAPWSPPPGGDGVEALMASRFDLPSGATARPVQRSAHQVAGQMRGPGLMIIEAPMGEGKTEAALLAAEVLAARLGCGGVMVALPTQATTDAMFTRIVNWLNSFGAHCQPVGAVTLAHGKAALNRVFRGLTRVGRISGVGVDAPGGCDCAVVAHEWLSGRKKAQLANVVVGTIDQLLFAALRSRHLALRHLGLVGKVVVIDEVHAYDVYMGSYLSRVLTWLGAYGVPVVALSATLPADRRHELVESYRRGAALAGLENDGAEQDAERPRYPLITWTDTAGVSDVEVPPSARRTTVALDVVGGDADNDLPQLTSLLTDLLSDGGCTLVVRNTVNRVLATAEALERAFPGEVSVAHSRYIAGDRARNDARLLELFGPPDKVGGNRPRRHIVVATQVIEQSLDVDFDVMVTDLAPVDLVLQRMGRLHRHDRGEGQSERPSKLRQARTYLTGIEFSGAAPVLERTAAGNVYHRHVLLRSAAALLPHLGGVVDLPGDIAGLVARAYGTDPDGPDTWQDEMNRQRAAFDAECAQRVRNAEGFQINDPPAAGKAILGWTTASVGDADEDSVTGQRQVRDGEAVLEVLLVVEDGDGTWRTPSWLPDGMGGLAVPVDRVPSRRVTEALMQCALRLPLTLSRGSTAAALRAQTPPVWQDSSLIRRTPAMVVDADGCAQVSGRRVQYLPDTGLHILQEVGA